VRTQGAFAFCLQSRQTTRQASASTTQKGPHLRAFLRADARTRTADPFITSEVLYQLSYVGVREAS
jgi:hypothetical protein